MKLFISEIKIVSHGFLAAEGIISFLIGSIMLISTDVSFELTHISLNIIITATILTALFFIFAVGKGIAAQRRNPVTGSQGMIGEIGTALSIYRRIYHEPGSRSYFISYHFFCCHYSC